MIEFNGTNYELKYTLKRIEMIENSTGVPMMSDLVKNSGMLSVAHLRTYIAYALKEEGAEAFMKIGEATKIAEALMEKESYAVLAGAVLEALQRDCPFFFRED